ncbi:hypothetical protein ACFOJG_08615 [Staphylococcus saprophyticus]
MSRQTVSAWENNRLLTGY